MKKPLLLGLALVMACFIAGGVFVATAYQNIVHRLEKVVSFHQVEFLRSTLEHHIEAVQTDLLLQGSPQARGFDHSMSLIETMEGSAEICLDCHHSDRTRERLQNLEKSVEHYMKLLSRSMTIRANNERRENARILAYSHGENLLKEVQTLSTASMDQIGKRIDIIQAELKNTTFFLAGGLVLIPIALMLLTAYFVKKFSDSLGTLREAAERLRSGDFDFRIGRPLAGEFQEVSEAINDMAESIKKEQKKYESTYQTYEALFETAGEAIMISGLDKENLGHILAANQAAADLYGYSTEELQNMNVIDLLPEKKEEKFLEQLRTILAGEWSNQKVRRRKKDGTQVCLDLSMGLVQQGEQKFLLSFCRDITAQLQAEEELQRANQMALVGQMSAGLAHEIKNPLAGIKVSLDVLADDLELEPEDQELFARIINEINRMEKLLKSLLNYARPPQPQFDFVDMNLLIDNTLKHVEVATRNSPQVRIHFEKDFDDRLPRLEGDAAQLQQVLLNILLNAVDAIELEGKISVTTRMVSDDFMLIEIADTGKGMNEDTLNKIFNPFYTTKTKGTGLGLSITKRLIEQHDGHIAANSQLDSGTSFVISLPLSQKHEEHLNG